MVISIIALALIVATLVYFFLTKKRSRLWLIIIAILLLRLCRIVNLTFIIKLLKGFGSLYTIGTINNVLTIIFYVLVIGLSVLLLVKEAKNKDN